MPGAARHWSRRPLTGSPVSGNPLVGVQEREAAPGPRETTPRPRRDLPSMHADSFLIRRESLEQMCGYDEWRVAGKASSG